MPKKKKLPHPDVAWEGVPLAFDNAKHHYAAAKALAEQELYGLAVSHLVLSAEEGVKAAMLGFHGVGLLPLMRLIRDVSELTTEQELSDPEEYLERILYHHPTKHEAAFFVLMMYQVITILQTKECEKLNEIFDVALDSLFLDPKSKPLFQAARWLEKADKLKQRGFYVDPPRKGSWQCPTSLTEKNYQEGLQHVGMLLNIMHYFSQKFQQSGYTPQQARQELEADLPRVTAQIGDELQESIAGYLGSLETRLERLQETSPFIDKNGQLTLGEDNE